MARKRDTGAAPAETTSAERLAEILGLDADELTRWARERSLFVAEQPLPALDFVRELVLTELRRAGFRGTKRGGS